LRHGPDLSIRNAQYFARMQLTQLGSSVDEVIVEENPQILWYLLMEQFMIDDCNKKANKES
jgi:hypothetical protein